MGAVSIAFSRTQSAKTRKRTITQSNKTPGKPGLRGNNKMNDYSTPYLALHKLLKQFHETITKGNYDKAYEISMDITDVAQNLEIISKELRDAYTD